MTTIGRLRELELLGRVVSAAEGGAGGVALIEGDPGIGKSHLLEAVAARVGESAVARGRAWEEGGAPPSWPWREVMRSLGAPIIWDEAHDRFAVYEQVVAALRNATTARPLLVLLDDLHAADADTLALTRFVARSVRDAPIAVVIAARPAQALARLAHDFVHVTLGPLSTAEITALVEQAAPVPLKRGARDDIVRIAEGNPLVAHELALSAGHDPDSGGALPQQLRDAVLERVATMSSPVRSMLDAAAVLGRSFNVGDVAGLLDCALTEVLQRLGPPNAARIVAAAPGAQWQFAHQIVRDAIYESIPIRTRLELHAAAARCLATPRSDARLDEQARHLVAAVPLVERDHAIDIARRAAAQATKSLAFGAAADTLRSAAALAEGRDAHLRLLLELGDAQLQAGRVTEAWETFDRALAVARAANDTAAVATALLGRTERVPSTSHARELAGLVHQALEVESDDRRVRARLLARYATLQAVAGAPELAERAAVEALDAARATGDDVVLGEVLTARHVTAWGPDDLEVAKEISDELVAVAARSGEPERILAAAMAQLVDQLRVGDIGGVDRTLERYRQTAGATQLPRHRFFLDSRRAMRAFLAGRLAEGQALLESAYRIAVAIEEPDADSVFHGARVMVLVDLADATDVCAEADLAEAVAAATGESRLLIFAAYLRSSADQRQEASRLLDQAVAPDFSNIARTGSWLMFMCMAAYVVARAPDRVRARRLYELLVPYRGRVVVNDGAVTFGGVVDHYLGLLAEAFQDTETASAHLDDAIANYQRLGATLFLARARQARDELGAQQDAPPAGAPPRALLRRSRGEWECGYSDSAFHLAHMVGLQHLARLIASPGEVHVLELAAPGSDRSSTKAAPQALLDVKGKAAYRARITDLREDLDEAEHNNDYERADHLRAELDAIVDELRRAVGLGGRDRTAATTAERARVAVRKSITAALDRLGDHDTSFAQHLRIHIKTGLYCRYEPDSINPIEWDM